MENKEAALLREAQFREQSELESARANQERQRAEQAEQAAQQERQRAAHLAVRLGRLQAISASVARKLAIGHRKLAIDEQGI